MFRALIILAALSSVLACPQHDFNIRAAHLERRADAGTWEYATSYTWGVGSENDTLCLTGTTQSPINLPSGSFSEKHVPSFDYSVPVAGELFNWGYGPSYKLNQTNGEDYSGNPSLKFDEETLYLLSWHTHTPSEHLIDNEHTRAELHLVHGDASGSPKAVVGIRINPVADESSPFLEQFVSQIPKYDSTERTVINELDMSLALGEVGNLEQFWTYRGSLTTPPCSEGLRWFVSGEVLEVSDAQMQALLTVSAFSSRVRQMVWNHGIGL